MSLLKDRQISRLDDIPLTMRDHFAMSAPFAELVGISGEVGTVPWQRSVITARYAYADLVMKVRLKK